MLWVLFVTGCHQDGVPAGSIHFQVLRDFANDTGYLIELYGPEWVCVRPERPLCFCEQETIGNVIGGLNLEERIDINRATGEELELLPGVGPTISARIVRYREQSLFRHPEDLMRVDGIGRGRYQRLHPLIRVIGEP
jgi:competence ComEA-like helix-hairpin-helix protein